MLFLSFMSFPSAHLHMEAMLIAHYRSLYYSNGIERGPGRTGREKIVLQLRYELT